LLAPLALSVVFGAMAFPALADKPAPRAPLGLTADAVGSVVDPLMEEWIGKHKGPGAVVVVVTSDATVFAQGYGFADVEAKRPFTADATLVRPGSISKLFTGIAVMQLVEAGKLDLDRDVNAYIDFVIPTPEGGVPVTLRRLLTHRAGFEEHVKGLFLRGGEPEPLGHWLRACRGDCFPKAMSRPIRITASRLRGTSSNAFRGSPTRSISSGIFSIRSAWIIRPSANPCRIISRR
jgi:CubicO group peptidase (beta-lactamase class C family)